MQPDKHVMLGVLLLASVICFCYSFYLWMRAKHEPVRRMTFLQNRSNVWLAFGFLGLAIAVFGW